MTWQELKKFCNELDEDQLTMEVEMLSCDGFGCVNGCAVNTSDDPDDPDLFHELAPNQPYLMQ